MNDEAKKFRSKYLFIPRRITLPQDVVDMMNKKENEILEIIERRKKMIDSNNKEDKISEDNQR